MALKLITRPADHPVSLEEIKAHLNVADDDHDNTIAAYLAAATGYVERHLGRRLVDQTWDLILDEFPDYEIKIPFPPLIEVVSVEYDDADGSPVTLSTDQYSVDDVSEPGWIVPASSWPSTFDGINAVRIRYRAGYVSVDSPSEPAVPEDIKVAIKLLVGTFYQSRESVAVGVSVSELPLSVTMLLMPHRIELSMA